MAVKFVFLRSNKFLEKCHLLFKKKRMSTVKRSQVLLRNKFPLPNFWSKLASNSQKFSGGEIDDVCIWSLNEGLLQHDNLNIVKLSLKRFWN